MKRIKLVIAAVTALCFLLMLTACGADTSVGVDKDIAAQLAGDYQVTGLEDNYWHLYIGLEEDTAILSIYDNAAGNPGVEGELVTLDESHIKLKYDKDLYEALPSAEWQLSGNDLEMTYAIDGDSLTLTNSDVSLIFQREAEQKIICANWNSDAENTLDSFVMDEETITLSGWVYDPLNDGWSETELSFEIAEDCIYNDCVSQWLTISPEEFRTLLDSDESANTVLELDVLGSAVEEVRLTEPDNSFLPF